MEKVIGIYKITNPNRKIYIGQSKNIFSRYNEYKKLHCKFQTKIYNSIKKYGWENHRFEVIHQCSIKELNELEKYYVDLFQTFNSKYGLNLRDGGGAAAKMSDETKNKISKTTKGRVGIKKTQEQKKAQSDRMMGKSMSIDTKFKMSLSKIGKNKSKNTKKKMSLYSSNRSIEHLERLSKSLSNSKFNKEKGRKMGLSNKGMVPYNKGSSKYNICLEYVFLKNMDAMKQRLEVLYLIIQVKSYLNGKI